MVPLPRRTLLLPALGFGVLCALALGIAHQARDDPSTSLYAAASAYVDSVYRGQDAEAFRYFATPRSPEVDLHLARLAGKTGHLLELEASPAGEEGTVRVVWADPHGTPVLEEVLRWVRPASGAWRIVRIEAAPRGGPRHPPKTRDRAAR